MIKKIALGFFAFLGLLKANVSFAVLKGRPPGPFLDFSGRSGGNDPHNLVLQVTEILLAVAGSVALLYIIIGGFYYVTSGTNEDLAKTGKKYLTNAIVGLIIILLSYTIISVVIKTFVADVPSSR